MAGGKYYHFQKMRAARASALAALALLLASAVLLPVLFRLGGNGLAAGLCLLVMTALVSALAVARADQAGWLFAWRLSRRFRAVCRERRLIIKDDAGRPLYARLRGLEGTADAWIASLQPLLGQSVADWERAAPAFVLAFRVAGVRFRDNGDGTIRMQAGYQAIAAQDFEPQPDDTAEVADWGERLAVIAVATTEGGRRYCLPLLGTHILTVGITGAGKGSVLWSIIFALKPGVKAGVVRLWAIDPKRLELAQGRALFADRYASTETDIVQLLERAVAEMEQLADQLAGVARKATPSAATPVNVLFIDELAVLSSLVSDRKTAQRIDSAIKRLLYLGRALNFVVVGAIQDPRKDNVDYRDGFPTKIAMKLDKPMIDLVLGAGSHEAGALCDLIPQGKAGAGVAFVKQEGAAVPVCVRFPWCSDELISQTAAALAPVIEMPRLAAS